MRILIVEDNKQAASVLCDVLKDVEGIFDVADLGEDAIAHATQTIYALIILDLSLPDMHGLEVLRRLRAGGAVAPILVLTGDVSGDMLVECMDRGADQYLSKPYRPKELVACVRALMRRNFERLSQHVEAKDAASKIAMLTDREREIMAQLVEGKTNKVTATELGLSPRTVEAHRARIMEKLNAKSLTEIVRTALAAERGAVMAQQMNSAANPPRDRQPVND